METPSILNDVLGPVMRGPSSSHTAGSYHIARTVRDLLGEEPARAVFAFDPGGSYARTFREQGVDLALTAGLLGLPITDRAFRTVLVLARRRRLRLAFKVHPLETADHPNTVDIFLEGRNGRTLRATAKSTGGGSFLVTAVDGWPVRVDGKSYAVFARAAKAARPALMKTFPKGTRFAHKPAWSVRGDEGLLVLSFREPPGPALRLKLDTAPGVKEWRLANPVFFIQKGEPLFSSASEIVRLAEKRRWTLGRAALAYESVLLGLPEADIQKELLRRYAIMKKSIEAGLHRRGIRMQLLRPTAHRILHADRSEKLAVGGLHSRAAARAMAALHVSNSMGIVCAAPTGGSAGVIPGVLATLAEERKLVPDAIARSLAAAGAVGLIVAGRATFAAEVAGCQVEIGAAGAMAAAAVVEAAGGTARQAANAAAISLQNTMGSVCDLVQGMCEIPCHTRNAVAASAAFVCADLIMGGYENPVPLDETIDASYASGRMLPAELRCTARGGLAMAPSARHLPNLRKRQP
jgi:L-serine dehydratase